MIFHVLNRGNVRVRIFDGFSPPKPPEKDNRRKKFLIYFIDPLFDDGFPTSRCTH